MAGHDDESNMGKEETIPKDKAWKDLQIDKREKEMIKFIKAKKIKQRKENGNQEDTNSFGEIEFVGFDQITNKTAPYVRLDVDTDMKIVWELLVNVWRIRKPNIVISVTGGHHDIFFKEDRLKILLSEELYKAAVCTGAWIVTDGKSSAIMELVGDAIREKSQETREDEVVVLGITGWNVLLNNKLLENSCVSQ
ncbi:transient receptor potential cation channel subfamily M member 8-like [Ptychodera flava]|uniref:transient receptor potential cation channel subfamily M member 8-like n=1 Tax=Ptychodera flava TaxID=63121 RepID=UPI00396AAF11